MFFVEASGDYLEPIIRKRSLQCFRLIPRRSHPDDAFFTCRQDYWHRVGWIGSTTAFGAVVRKP
jgi:hypothetical protein